MSPGNGLPLGASTPMARAADLANGNVNVNIVSESTYSMDVLSGGESDAGDTLTRQNNNNNNSVSSNLPAATRDGSLEPKRRADITYSVAKELLMTERTYKRDLELVTVTWSRHVSELAADVKSSGNVEAATALARACLALEPLALACGALLARLERILTPHKPETESEPEYKKIAELLYDYLSSTYDVYEQYTENAGPLVGLVENVRRNSPAARAQAAAFEAAAPLPLACLLLRPLHRRTAYLHTVTELYSATKDENAAQALEIATRGAETARLQLHHVENHAALCQIQRDVIGYDKLLVPDRELVRLGCVYKHSTRGLQQRMMFLFNDVLVVTSRAGTQFRAHGAFALRPLSLVSAHLPHSFELQGENVHLLISTSNEQEYIGWTQALESAINSARDCTGEVDVELTVQDNDTECSSAAASCGGALTQVCWHRAASLSRDHLHLALQTQLSGYLLRKFKKSPGWQKLWVVFAAFTLLFYKSWHDAAPLASLPLLGYSVSGVTPSDGVDKEFVFKLQYKNHVYFFRADGPYTYSRWMEVLKTPMVRNENN